MPAGIICQLCGRRALDENCVEKHDLILCAKGGRHGPTIIVCIDCGNHVHALFDNKELKENFSSLEKLRQDPRMQRWIRWIRRQKRFGVCHKDKKRR